MSKRFVRLAFALLLLALMLVPAAASAQTQKFPDAINNTWAGTDWIVWASQEARTWMWGPGTFDQRIEPYAQSPNGQRQVFYYDKSRMEISDPVGDASSIWYVTNGLLVNELMSGRLQVGNDEFEEYFPAQVNVAGDADDANGPTYATMGSLAGLPPHVEGAAIVAKIDRSGSIGDDQSLAGLGVTAGVFVPETNHRVASPFWNFMNSTGKVYDPATRAVIESAPLFPNPYFATGFPVTEAYWSTVKVGGTLKTVLVQCFERRCLTYTPDNAPEWQVEAGNVGRHYHTWRYVDIPLGPPDDPIPPVPTEGAVYYESDMRNWNTGALSGSETFIADDGFHVRVTQSDYGHYDYLDANLADFSAQVDVRAVDPATGQNEGCLVYRYDNANSNIRDYSFCINNVGEVYAYLEEWTSDGAYQAEGLLSNSTHAAVRPAGEWNTLKVVAQGNQFWFIVNGQAIGHAVNDRLTVGDIGVSVYNYQNSPTTEWAFRNMALRTLGDAPPPAGPPTPGETVASFDPATGWNTGQLSQNINAEVRDNLYHVRAAAQSSYQFYAGENTYNDASVSVETRLTDGSGLGASCVVARFVEDPWRNYELCLMSNGASFAGYYDEQQDYVYLLEESSRSGFAPLSEWNTLEIRARGNRFWFFANGTLLGEATHDGVGAGYPGFQIMSFDPNSVEWAYRNLVVRALQ